jgi:hypothetical protein
VFVLLPIQGCSVRENDLFFRCAVQGSGIEFAIIYRQLTPDGSNRSEREINMYNKTIDESKCDHAEKEVIEGLCLSYDLVKGVCLETMEPCVAIQENDE